MAGGITSVRFDAHRVWIKVAVLLPGEKTPVEWQVENEKASSGGRARDTLRPRLGPLHYIE